MADLLDRRRARRHLHTPLAVVFLLASACGNGVAPLGPNGTYPLLLVASSVAPLEMGTSFDGTSWAPVAPLSTTASGLYGGVLVLPDGRGLGIALDHGTGTGAVPGSSLWSAGAWSPLTPFDNATDLTVLGAPVATASGAVVVELHATAGVRLATFDAASSTWSTGQDLGFASSPIYPVVVAHNHGADLLVLTSSNTQLTYLFTQRLGGTWSAPAAVPGFGAANQLASYHHCVAAARRANSDAIVAAFCAIASDSPGAAPYQLEVATFEGGAWSAPTNLATNLDLGSQAVAIAALRDGRVALAFVDEHAAVFVVLYDGTTWGTPRAVPGVMVHAGENEQPLAIAPGHDAGAVVELAFLDITTQAVVHTRLTDEAAWSWTTPVTVDATGTYNFVALGTSPMP